MKYLLFIALSISAFAQVYRNTESITGAKPGSIDTVNLERTSVNLQESQGLMEKAIDPKLYLVGPGDKFIVSIIGVGSKQSKVIVSPDGRLFIPDVGAVMVNKLTLNEAYKIVEEKIRDIFPNSEIYIVISDIKKFKVRISGKLGKSQIVSATSTDRVSEVIDRAGGLDFDASTRNIRLLRNDRFIDVDLTKFYMLGNEEDNPFVQGGDQIIIPYTVENNLLLVTGEISDEEQEFEYSENDSLSTLVKLTGGFLPSAKLDEVEFSRINNIENKMESSFLDLSSWDQSIQDFTDKSIDFKLMPGDRLFIRKIKDWEENKYVVIEGEVNYPNKYPIPNRELRLSELIEKAGGITDKADLNSAIYIRQEEENIEDPELERLRKTPAGEMSKSEFRYFQVRIREVKGLMAVNFKNLMSNSESDDNIIVQDKDSIFIPTIKEYINIQGKVNSPGAVPYKKGYTYIDYIQLAGGFESRADERETFITKQTGEQYLARSGEYSLEPGDVILVPPKEESDFWNDFFTFFTFFTQIVTVASVIITVSR